VEAGEEVTIVRDGSPVARLVAVRRSREAFLGMDRGKFTVPEDFNDPDPEFEKFFE
jgi:antitoxin (DNA-binding transcriptional repressor) of toxin-antitoxin stability system